VLTQETLILSIHIYLSARDINTEHWIWRNNWIYKQNIIFYDVLSKCGGGGRRKPWLHVYLPYSLLHTYTPKPWRDISGHLYFAWIIVIFTYCVRPLLGIMPIPRTLILVLSCASLVVGLNDRHTGQDTNTNEICVRSIVTRLVKFPVTLCILEHLCCKLHPVTFAAGARGASLHRSTAIKRLGIQLLWTFDYKLLPPSLLTSQLWLGMQQT